MTRPARIRRLEPVYVADCNGDDRDGCRWQLTGSDLRPLRAVAQRHAWEERHEVVIRNVNDGLVLDGRKR